MNRFAHQHATWPVIALAFVVAAPALLAQQDVVYLSGLTGTQRDGQSLTTIEDQTVATLEGLGAALREHGLDYSDVVVSNVFLSDSRLFAGMNGVYRRYFPSNPPTRATVQADLPDPAALIQISAVATGQPKEVITPAGLRSPQLPYSWGIKVGNTLFLAGATSRSPDTYEPERGTVGEQTRRIFGNMGLVLEAAGMSYGDLTSCKVFLDDARAFGAMNTAYREFVPEDIPPARATARAGLMNPLFDAEIQCVAEQSAQRRFVMAEGGRRPRSPFSPGVSTGSRLYLSGMVGGGSGDVAEQTENTIRNLHATLTAAGMGFEDVVDVWIYVTDIRQWDDVRNVLDARLPGLPAPTVVGMPLMGSTLLVEIQMTAERGGN